MKLVPEADSSKKMLLYKKTVQEEDVVKMHHKTPALQCEPIGGYPAASLERCSQHCGTNDLVEDVDETEDRCGDQRSNNYADRKVCRLCQR